MTLTFKFEGHALKQLKLAGIKPMTIVEEYEFVLGIHLTYLTLRSNLRSKVMKPKVAIKWKFGLPGSLERNFHLNSSNINDFMGGYQITQNRKLL